MGRPGEIMQEQITPLARLIVPVLLALIMFILNGMNNQLAQQTAELAKIKSDQSVLLSRIAANETAIQFIREDGER